MGVRARRRGRMLTPQDKFTPLHSAVYFGQVAVARVLVDAGADKEAKKLVSQRKGGMLSGQTVLFLLGVASRRLIVSVLAKVG